MSGIGLPQGSDRPDLVGAGKEEPIESPGPRGPDNAPALAEPGTPSGPEGPADPEDPGRDSPWYPL